jgi:iron complex outermembrane receptor protein
MRTSLWGSFIGLLALAQSVAAESSLAIEEVIVTAEKREASIQDVGLAVSALDLTAIERLNARDIRDLQGIIPNLTLNEVAIGPSMSQVSIRGVNSQDPEKSFDPAVGVFIDGVYLGSSAYNLLDTFDLERIEVLRGPQGTLFGRNTTGGAINAFRTKPTGELGMRAAAVMGNDGRRDLKAVFNTPITEELALKISGYDQTDDGWWENETAGGSEGARDRWNAALSLLWTPSDRAEVQLTYDHGQDDSDLVPYVPRGVAAVSPLPILVTDKDLPVPADVRAGFAADRWCVVKGTTICSRAESASNGPHFQNSEMDALTLNADIDLNETYTLATVVSWREHEEAVYIDFDGTADTVFDVVRFQDYEQTSAEIRLASNLEGPFNFIVGAFHFESEYGLKQAIKLDLANAGAPVPAGALYVNGNGDEDAHEATSQALFVQSDIDLTDTVTLTLGLRGSWDDREIATEFYGSTLAATAAYSVTDGIPAGRTLLSSGSNQQDWFELTPKAALNWAVSDQVMMYGSYTRGYNAGGFSARAGTVTTVTEPFDPEFINAYEIGVKSDLLDGRLRLNAAFFINDYDDKQEEAIEPAPAPTFTSTTVRNVAGARIAGVEFEVSALLTDYFRLDANLGLMDAEYTEWDGFLAPGQYVSNPAQPSNTLVEADLSTLELRRAPEVTASLIPQFFLPLGSGEIEANAIFRYVDNQFTEILNNARGEIEAQLLVDASISYTFGGDEGDRYVVKAFGRNLTDEQEFVSFTNSIVDFSTIQPPRQYGVEFQVNL